MTEFETNDLADRLVPDPANPNVRRLEGFILGRSTRDDYLRLYLTPDMTDYFEFEKSATVHAAQLKDNRTVVWVRPDAQIDVTRKWSVRGADYLRGNIVGAQLGGAVASGFRTMARMAAADGSGCAHTGCSAGCTEGYGCPGGGGSPTYDYTCDC